MKRLTVLVMVVLLAVCSAVNISANEVVGNVYQIQNVTVIFDADSQFSDEQQEMLAQLLVTPEYGVSKANLICSIFGHKNTSETVISITHKASETDPRCLQENFVLTNCSRCDETTVERVSYFYIPCCPED